MDELLVTHKTIELALRQFIARDVDYDIHKYFECTEDEGIDIYPDKARLFFNYLVEYSKD